MRRALKIGGVAIGVAVIALAAALFALWSGAKASNVGELEFAAPLAIPPLAEARTDAEGRVRFDLELQAGETELLPGIATETWGVNGPHLAPTLRASRGDLVAPRVANGLPSRATTVHWHGMHLPARADGGPHQEIAPGETWAPEWEVDQPAATLWYHPHPHGETEEHVYRGAVGMFIVDDAESDRLPLPSEYGVDDIPLIVQDVKLDGDGQLDFSKPLLSMTGVLGDEILVNGTRDPHLDVTSERVRLRVVNASAARIYDIGFDDERAFDLIAGDGGLLAAPVQMQRVMLSPGERAEIVAQLSPGEQTILRSFAPDLGANPWEERFAGGDDSFDLLELRAADRLAPSPEVPDELAPLAPPDASAATNERSFRMSHRRSINSTTMDMSRVDEIVNPGSTEVWEVGNASSTPHNFHPHGVSFRVIEYLDEPPPAHLAGAKDTIYLPPNGSAKLLIEFDDHDDPHHPYMLHCHILDHEDRGMMLQYAVTDEEPRVDGGPHGSQEPHGSGHRQVPGDQQSHGDGD